jgi:hypothetical protein
MYSVLTFLRTACFFKRTLTACFHQFLFSFPALLTICTEQLNDNPTASDKDVLYRSVEQPVAMEKRVGAVPSPDPEEPYDSTPALGN